jgi:hypothetical protein
MLPSSAKNQLGFCALSRLWHFLYFPPALQDATVICLVTYYLSGALNLQNLIKNLASLAKNKTGEFLSWVKWKFIIFQKPGVHCI